MSEASGFNVIRITRREFNTMLLGRHPRNVFPDIKALSKARGLIYPPPAKPDEKKLLRFRTWFEPNGDFCQQNYIA